MTLDEITAHEDQLLVQIADCQRLLAACRDMRAEGETSLPLHHEAVAVDERVILFHPEPAAPPVLVAASVPLPPAANLEALSKGYGGGIRVVTWAIRQMSGDFTVRDIAAALRQAGYPRRMERLSVILNRMKDDGKITEVTTGRGRTPSTFRATAAINARPLEFCARHSVTRPRGTFRPAVAWSKYRLRSRSR